MPVLSPSGYKIKIRKTTLTLKSVQAVIAGDPIWTPADIHLFVCRSLLNVTNRWFVNLCCKTMPIHLNIQFEYSKGSPEKRLTNCEVYEVDEA